MTSTHLAQPGTVRGRFPTRAAVLALVAAPLVAGTAAAAPAEAAGFVRDTHTEGLFYGNFEEDVLLFVGATPQQFCSGDEPTVPSRVFVRGDRITEKVGPVKMPLYLYSSPLEAPELIDAVCGGASAEPFAEGVGRVKMRITVTPDDNTVHIVNSAVGRATSSEGTYRVKGAADLFVIDDDVQGDPADFQSLKLTLTRCLP